MIVMNAQSSCLYSPSFLIIMNKCNWFNIMFSTMTQISVTSCYGGSLEEFICYWSYANFKALVPTDTWHLTAVSFMLPLLLEIKSIFYGIVIQNFPHMLYQIFSTFDFNVHPCIFTRKHSIQLKKSCTLTMATISKLLSRKQKTHAPSCYK
jgi:hypothetical protein